MRISSHTHETAVAGQQTELAPHKTAERSFDQLLNDKQGSITPPRREQNRTGALGFGALGVFGRYGAWLPEKRASAAGAGDHANQPIIVESDVSLAADVPAQTSAMADLRSGWVSPPFTGDVDMTGLNTRRTIVPQELMSQSAAGDDGSRDLLPLSAVQPDEELPGAAGEAQQLPEPRDGNSSNPLFVLGKDDALNVIARGAGEDHAALRGRLEETATQFGMKIADFQFHASSTPSFIEALGGQNGSRTR
jgi:hypothetical protein